MSPEGVVSLVTYVSFGSGRDLRENRGYLR